MYALLPFPLICSFLSNAKLAETTITLLLSTDGIRKVMIRLVV